MRETKFRAWDKKEKKMCNDALIIGNIGLGEGSVTVTEDVEKGNELIWMQFTGLKDKNGKEIFEGDYVYVRWNGFGIVRFEYGRFYVKGKDGKTTELSTHWGEDCEIIGNIYENPELLEEK